MNIANIGDVARERQEAAVTRGIELLDEQWPKLREDYPEIPREWRPLISPADFSVQNADRCPLGSLGAAFPEGYFEGPMEWPYQRMARLLGIRELEQMQYHGFVHTESDTYAELTAVWSELLWSRT